MTMTATMNEGFHEICFLARANRHSNSARRKSLSVFRFLQGQYSTRDYPPKRSELNCVLCLKNASPRGGGAGSTGLCNQLVNPYRSFHFTSSPRNLHVTFSHKTSHSFLCVSNTLHSGLKPSFFSLCRFCVLPFVL